MAQKAWKKTHTTFTRCKKSDKKTSDGNIAGQSNPADQSQEARKNVEHKSAKGMTTCMTEATDPDYESVYAEVESGNIKECRARSFTPLDSVKLGVGPCAPQVRNQSSKVQPRCGISFRVFGARKPAPIKANRGA